MVKQKLNVARVEKFLTKVGKAFGSKQLKSVGSVRVASRVLFNLEQDVRLRRNALSGSMRKRIASAEGQCPDNYVEAIQAMDSIASKASILASIGTASLASVAADDVDVLTIDDAGYIAPDESIADDVVDAAPSVIEGDPEVDGLDLDEQMTLAEGLIDQDEALSVEDLAEDLDVSPEDLLEGTDTLISSVSDALAEEVPSEVVETPAGVVIETPVDTEVVEATATAAEEIPAEVVAEEIPAEVVDVPAVEEVPAEVVAEADPEVVAEEVVTEETPEVVVDPEVAEIVDAQTTETAAIENTEITDLDALSQEDSIDPALLDGDLDLEATVLQDSFTAADGDVELDGDLVFDEDPESFENYMDLQDDETDDLEVAADDVDLDFIEDDIVEGDLASIEDQLLGGDVVEPELVSPQARAAKASIASSVRLSKDEALSSVKSMISDEIFG